MLGLAGKDFEKSRFSRPIRADYPVAVAGGKFEVNILKERTLSVTEAKVGNGYHLYSTRFGIFPKNSKNLPFEQGIQENDDCVPIQASRRGRCGAGGNIWNSPPEETSEGNLNLG
jgi:hypothetical protein